MTSDARPLRAGRSARVLATAAALALALSLAISASRAQALELSRAPRQATVVEIPRPLPPALAETVADTTTAEMTDLGIPGLSLAIGEGGELRFAAGFGTADIENGVPASSETVYRLASVSKPMTAVAALRLAEQGRLDLDAPAWKYCASFPAKPWAVTARELLCHQGGVRNYRRGESVPLRRFTSVPEALVVFKDDPLVYEPGTSVLYTTYGYCLLGCVVEGAAGRPFIDVLREDVFGPAGMTSTRVDDPLALIPHRARGYARDEAGDLVNSALVDVTYKVPGGGLCGTAPDVARFGLALLSGRLLDRSTLEQMLTAQRLRTGRRTGFGLGLVVDVRGRAREAWHVGGQERVSTLLYLRPDAGVVVAVLSNLEKVQRPLLSLGRRLADLLAPSQKTR